MATQLSAGILTVLQVVANYGPISPHEICEKVELSPRTVTLALSTLTENRICKRIPNLSDMRKPLYVMNNEIPKSVLAEYVLDSVIRTPPAGLGWRP